MKIDEKKREAVIDAARGVVAAQLACNDEAKRHPSSRSSAPMVRYITAMARLDAALAALDDDHDELADRIDGEFEIDAKAALDDHEDEDDDHDELADRIERVLVAIGAALRDDEDDRVTRPAGCACQCEQGDSPCPVHGEESE